ncbi:MAG: hypothetical protein IJU78_08535 [Clostridia bacterium]|nr:hypothetical protein [Clostridia bacterium]
MEYIYTAEASVKWNMTLYQVEEACRKKRIPGALEQNGDWLVPADARRPVSRCCPFLSMTNLYSAPGSADHVAEVLPPDEALLFRAQLAYYRGEIDVACAASRRCLNQDSDLNTHIGTGMILSLVAMYRGDKHLWQEAMSYIEAAPCHNTEDEEQRLFWLAAASSAIYDTKSFPDWFQRGSFEHLPVDSYPSAYFFYIKQLLVFCQETAVLWKLDSKQLSTLRVIPAIAEPLISQAQADGALLPEIYLRLLCAVGLHDCGDAALASIHVDRAIELALPDRLLSPLAEYRRQLHFLMDDRLRKISPEAVSKVRALNKKLLHGWVKLHNAVLDRTVSNELTVREHEVARLATVGLSNQEIAERLNLTVSTIKQTLHNVMNKTDTKNRRELNKHL